jgi:hypothetical protein
VLADGLLSLFVLLAERDGAADARPFQAEVDPANAREEGEDFHRPTPCA